MNTPSYPKIDLQLHSTYSDWHDTPKEIAELAHKTNVSVISLTEHDNVFSYRELEHECEKYWIKAVPWVEISATYRGGKIHLLWYNIDVDSPHLQKFLNDNIELKKAKALAQFDKLNKNLEDAWKKTADISSYEQRDYRYFTLPGLALFLYEEWILPNKSDWFNYLKGINTGSSATIEDAIAVINKAKWKSVLSHPLAPKISLREISTDSQEQEKMLIELIGQWLDWIECFTACHSKEETQACLELAEKYGLIITWWSDWHGQLWVHIKEWVKAHTPYYVSNFGGLEIDEAHTMQILKGLGLN
jgi:3',5'-nucleoside bisphosphate phosphatase